MLGNNGYICPRCISKMRPIFKKFKIGDVDGLTLFSYDVFMKDLIYKFKGCYDIELKDLFLGMYRKELNFLYKGYTLVPAPSYEGEDSLRGFNHVEEIFSVLGLNTEKLFVKTAKYKQSDQRMRDRKNIGKYIKIKDDIKDIKKVLLVDDIYTTGATMKTLISLLKSKGINDIKVLVVCKTLEIDKRK